MGWFNSKDEKKKLRQINPTIVIDRSRQGKYAFYTLAKDGRSDTRNGFVTLKVFPATVSQKEKDGKILPEVDFVEPLELQVHESQLDEYVQGDWDSGRNIIEINAVRVDEFGVTMKTKGWYKDREPLMRKIESQNNILESMRKQMPETANIMHEIMSWDGQEDIWSKIATAVNKIQEMNKNLNTSNQPRPENKPIEGQRQW